METFSNAMVPMLIGSIIAFGLYKKVNIFEEFLAGAGKGLQLVTTILPALVILLTAVTMFEASGAMNLFVWALSPLANAIGFPVEIVPLALMRPISGSGAMVVFTEILNTHGPDSYLGQIASVLQGSTETTFYTIALYYGATKIQNTKHTLLASLAGDCTGIYCSVLTVGWFLSTIV